MQCMKSFRILFKCLTVFWNSRGIFYLENPLCVLVQHLINELVITESAHFQVVSINSFDIFFFQVISALAVSFGPFAVGLGKGYTSPALASLLPNPSEDKSDEIPPFSPHLPNITITEQEGKFIKVAQSQKIYFCLVTA